MKNSHYALKCKNVSPLHMEYDPGVVCTALYAYINFLVYIRSFDLRKNGPDKNRPSVIHNCAMPEYI